MTTPARSPFATMRALAVLVACALLLAMVAARPAGAGEAGGDVAPIGVEAAVPAAAVADDVRPAVDAAAAAGAAAIGDASETAADASMASTRLMVRVDADVSAAHVEAVGADAVASFTHLDELVVDVSSREQLERLSKLHGVRSIELDHLIFPSEAASTLAEVREVVGQPSAATGGATGSDQVIAILDTGISLSAFDSSVCTAPGAPGCAVVSADEVATAAPPITGYTSPGSADGSLDDDTANRHGTRVSLMAVASAPMARIAFIDVFAKYTCSGSGAACPYGSTALISSDSMVAAGIDRAIALRQGGAGIRVLNLSATTAATFTPGACPTGLAGGFGALRTAGILPVVAAGNAGSATGVGAPGCLASVLTVGSTYSKGGGTNVCGSAVAPAVDAVTCFTNSSTDVDVLAPGSNIAVYSAVVWGTSFSAPFVAGAAAAMFSKVAESTPTGVKSALQTSGPSVRDDRNGVSRPRLSLPAAVAVLQADPTGDALRSFQPISPLRVLETRGAPYGPIGTSVGPLSTELRLFDVAGPLDISPADVASLALNLTGISPDRDCYLTVWPGGTAQPYSSNLNLLPGQTLSNSVIVSGGALGTVAISASCAAVDVAVDVTGWFPTAAEIDTVAPSRIVDTRPGSSVGVTQPGAISGELVVDPLGRGGLPSDPSAMDSVLVNVTVDGPTEAAYLTIWPSGSEKPYTSSLNFAAGQTATNFHIAKLGPDGRFALAASNGATQIVIDVFGWVPTSSLAFSGLEPARILDTRSGFGTCAGGCDDASAGAVVRVKVREVASVPGFARAVALKVTAASATAPTYLALYPAGDATPNASNLFVTPGSIIPNLVMAKVGPDGYVDVYNAAGITSVVADVVGYYR